MWHTKTLTRPAVVTKGEYRLAALRVRTTPPGLALTHVPDAQSAYGISGAGLTVAVIDSGLRRTHTDFSPARVVGTTNLTDDNAGSPDDASDGHGHGTHIAGIIGANGVHRGVAPECQFYAVKIVDNVGVSNFAKIAAALELVIQIMTDYQISIVHLSMGDGKNHKTVDELEQHYVSTLIRLLYDRHIPVVCSAGNDFYKFQSSQGMTYPGILSDVISVGSVYEDNIGPMYYSSGAITDVTAPDIIAPYSQRLHPSTGGKHFTTVFAPGGMILSTGIFDDYSSSRHDGTSHAAPFVTGAILLMQELYKRSTGNLPAVSLIKEILARTADPIVDGDNEDDNVINTGLQFCRLNVLGAARAITEHLQS